MKFLLLFILLLTPICANAQQERYELDSWFWNNHFSSLDSLYTQDADIENRKASIPVQLSKEDFIYLDSVATSIGFWSLPDTIRRLPDTVWKNGKMEILQEFRFQRPGRTSFQFQTPKHRKSIEIISFPRDKGLGDKIYALETAIEAVLKSKQYYKTLPRKMMRD